LKIKAAHGTGLFNKIENPRGLNLLRALPATRETRPGASGWITWLVLGVRDA
jgi:hypothetical protein